MSQFEEFTKAFASPVLLDWTDEGYDTGSDTKLDEKCRLKDYVDLLVSVFEDQTAPVAGANSDHEPSSAGLTQKFKVVDRLCHRESIHGRATTVLRLHEVRDSAGSEKTDPHANANGKRKRDEGVEVGQPFTKDYVVKVTWRDLVCHSESEAMEHFKGVFGLAQHVWHSDSPGRYPCPSPTEGQYWNSSRVATIAQWDRIGVCDNLWGIAIPAPMDDEDAKERDHGGDDSLCAALRADTTQYRSTSSTRKRQIFAYTLMSSVGVPLSEASSPSEFMNTMLDAILGYWRVFNMGVLHRDTSDENVMVLHRGHSKGTDDGENDLKRQKLPQEPWLAALRMHEPVLAESEYMLRIVLARLNRSLTGTLPNLDLHAKCRLLAPRSTIDGTQDCNPITCTGLPTKVTSGTTPPESKRRRMSLGQGLPVSPEPSQSTIGASTACPNLSSRTQECQEGDFDSLTGNRAFMSIRLLEVTPGTSCYHSYLDDLESFFWLILWSVAAHLDKGSHQLTSAAHEILDFMNHAKRHTLSIWKTGILSCCRDKSGDDVRSQLNSYNNAWAKDPAVTNIIIRLGKYLERFDSGDLPVSSPPATVFSVVVNIILEELGA